VGREAGSPGSLTRGDIVFTVLSGLRRTSSSVTRIQSPSTIEVIRGEWGRRGRFRINRRGPVSHQNSQSSATLPGWAMNATCRRWGQPAWRGTRRHSTATVKRLLTEKPIDENVAVTGWITRRRMLKNATFLDFVDGSTHRHLQVVAPTVPERYSTETRAVN